MLIPRGLEADLALNLSENGKSGNIQPNMGMKWLQARSVQRPPLARFFLRLPIAYVVNPLEGGNDLLVRIENSSI